MLILIFLLLGIFGFSHHIAQMTSYSLMIHGGAGAISHPERFNSSLHDIVASGAKLLADGASALDAVTHCVALLEDDPLYNAGRGSVLNASSEIFCDASIMEGRTLMAGAAASIQSVRNPVRLARAILEKSEHVFLIGAGAEDFAREQGLAFEEKDYFLTDLRVSQLAKAKARRAIALDHAQDGKLGTVGAVARDMAGNLAAATSTGGVTNQARGRVGDSPIIGAGTYADNASCAISCTGVGEHFIRASVARSASFFVEYQHMDAEAAAKATLDLLRDKVNGVGGLIIIDRNGHCARAFSTQGMLSATAQNGEILVDTR